VHEKYRSIAGQTAKEYQRVTDVRGVARDARFSLLDGLSTPDEVEGESQ